MAASPLNVSNNNGFSFNLNTLVPVDSNKGILAITGIDNIGQSTGHALPSLAVAATLLDSGDYMAGSTTLVGVQDTVESLGGGGLLVGSDASPFSAPLTVSAGEVGSILAITQKVPTGELSWVGGAPLDGQFLGYTTADGIKWANNPSGTVTSVNASSSTGLTIGGVPITDDGTITIDLPSGGALGQVLGITATGPQTLGWIANTPVTLPAGVAILSALSDPWDGFVGFVYDDPNVTATTVVQVTSLVTVPGVSQEAAGYLYVVTYPEGFDTHPDPCIVIFSSNSDDVGNSVAWSIVTYNGSF